jgi:hypothetical protein
MLQSDVTRRWGSPEPALFALATVGSGALSLFLGQDSNYDQLNYHVYLGWAFLNDRIDVDVAPVGVASYLNPVIQSIHYVGLTSLPPRLFGFALGAVHGLNAYLVYRLARLVLSGVGSRVLLAAVAGLVAASGPCAVSLLATTFGDNLLSIPVLAAFLLLARAAEEPGVDPTRRLVLAGLLGGIATGLKLTLGIDAVGLLAAAAAVAFRRRSARVCVVFAAAGAAGGLIAGGYWGWQMWRRFGNPVFPFLNNVFRSPYFVPEGLRDARWAARDWMAALKAPVEMALGPTDGLQEVAFRDVRYLVLLVVAGVALAVTLGSRHSHRPASPAAAVLGVAWLTAYLVWIAVFHYYRYFAAGEFLAPVAILALLRVVGDRRLALAWLAIAIVVVATTRTGSWGRIRWQVEPLRVEVPLGKPAAVLMDSTGVSFVAPFFPPGSRFFGTRGAGPALEQLVARELDRYPGPIVRLCRYGAPPEPLEKFGLVDEGRCKTIRSGSRGRLSVCRLARLSR